MGAQMGAQTGSQMGAQTGMHTVRGFGRNRVSHGKPPATPESEQMSVQYTITELAREFDVTPRAIRFYEDQGLLSPSREGSSGLRRVYSARDRTRLKLTLRGKRLGFTLSEIRDLLDLYDSPTDTSAQLQAFLATLARHRAVLERQREDLDATLEDLAQYEAQARALLERDVYATERR